MYQHIGHGNFWVLVVRRSSVFAVDPLSVQCSLFKLLVSFLLPTSFNKAVTLVFQASASKLLNSGSLP